MSTINHAPSNVLFGQIRGKVLALLFGWPDNAFYVRQIARHVHASVGAVQRELEKLAAADLLVRTSIGNQVFYQVNRQNPVFPEMRALVNKTVGLFNVLSSSLEPLSQRIVAAFVYGSMARQEERAGSDIDLMIIGNVGLDDVLARTSPAETTLGRAINPTVYSMNEFKKKLAAGNHFLSRVADGDKVLLIGNEDDLGKGRNFGMVQREYNKSRQGMKL